MLTTLLIVLAAQALPQAAPPPPEAPVGRPQVFIAPSGEPFRAPGGAPYPVADWFARADADHDGKLTEPEFTADFLRFFTSLDGNRDGIVDAAELERYEATTPELHSTTFGGGWSRGDEVDEEGKPRPRKVGSYMGADDAQGGGRFDLLRIPEPVAAMDTTLKGRINRQEAQDAAEYRFAMLDTQHHGYLALADLPKTYAQTHRGGGKGGGPGRGGHGGRGMGGHRGGGGGMGGMGGGGMGSGDGSMGGGMGGGEGTQGF